MRKEEKGEEISELGNWNVADSYSKSKIMRPLIMCDYYEDIANNGYDSLIEELINYQSPPNDYIRIKALKRLIKELIRLIKNTKFALKKEGTKTTILIYLKHLKKLEKIVPKLWEIKYNSAEGRREVVIKDEIIYNEFLEKVSEIKSKINEPLNKNHLIFVDKEEFDPRAFKERTKDRMRNQG